MPKLYVTEFAQMGNQGFSSDLGGVPQVAKLPSIGTQVVDFSTSTASAAFNQRTRFIRVHTDGNCHITVTNTGTPTATTSHARMAADQTEYFAVEPGARIAAVAA